MMGGCNTRNMQREELSEIKYLRLLHQVGVFIYQSVELYFYSPSVPSY